MRRAACTVLLLIALSTAAIKTADADFDVAGQVTVATDYVFRGVSQTMSTPALQGELGFEHHSGAYGFVWASNVDFTDTSDPNDGAEYEIDLGAGFVVSVSNRFNIDVGATAYLFPSTNPGFDYDYLEWHSAITLDDTHTLTLGYSDNVFGAGEDGVFYSVASGFDLAEQVGVSIELGHYDLERAFSMSYSYAELAIEGSLQAVDWRLSYFSTTNQAEDAFFESTISDRVMLALSLSFD